MHHAILAGCTALALAAAPVNAQDFVIDGTFVNPDATNGPFTDTAFDADGTSVLMKEGSSIDVSDTAGDNAIQATGNGITIEARGALSTQGNGADEDGNGIYIFGDGAVMILTETGSITTGGVRAYGQFIAGDDGFISNSGSITIGDGNAPAQLIRGDFGTLNNNGTITTHGHVSYGQSYRGTGGRIINTGTITTSGGSANAQDTFSDIVIINTGTITTWGKGAEGQTGSDLNNSGSITVFGQNSRGQFLTRGGGSLTNSGTLTNSGRVVSVNNRAISTDDRRAGRTLNFLAPGFIGGNINIGSYTPATVNIVTGPSHSIFWTLDGNVAEMVGGAPNISGPVPWFYDAATQIVATFDPTLLSSETDALGDLTALLSRVGLGALESPDPAVGGNSPLAYQRGDNRRPQAVQATDQALQGDGVTHRMGRVWATGLGGSTDFDGSATTLGSTIEHVGFAAGYAWQHNTEVTLNAMGGYVSGKAKADAPWARSFDHDTHTVFAGLGGEQDLGRGAIQFGLTAGYQWVDHNRFVNDNLAPLGESWVTANYGGFFVSPELVVSTDIAMANGITLTPNAGLRYAAQWLGGYSETGAVNPAANATVAARFVGVLEARAGLEASRVYDFGILSGRIGYLGRWNGGNDVAGITLNGSTQDVASGYQALNAVTVGATLRSAIGETGFLELDTSYLYGDTAHGFGGWLTMGRVF